MRTHHDHQTGKEKQQAQFSSQAKPSGGGEVTFVDNRPRAITQRKLVTLANRATNSTGSNVPLQLRGGANVIQRNRGMGEQVKLSKALWRYKMERPRESRFTKQKEELVLEDAIKVRAYLRDLGGTVKLALAQLESDILEQLKMSSAEEPNSRHLTRALAVREKQCGLEAATSIYTEILEPGNFMAEAGKGAMFNDWGAISAALTHGEYTHRIQWYVLLYGMSEGFNKSIDGEPPKGFNYTPKELLKEINLSGVKFENKEVNKGGLTEKHNLWDVLFDRPSLGMEGSSSKKNKEIGITDPERFMIMMDNREGVKAGRFNEIFGMLKEEAPHLSEILTRRQELRKRQKSAEPNRGVLDPEVYENRKLESGRYRKEGKGLLVRNKPQSLVGSQAGDVDHVPYAPSVKI